MVAQQHLWIEVGSICYGRCKGILLECVYINVFFLPLSLRYQWCRAVLHPFIPQPTALSLPTSYPSDLATRTTVEMPRTSVLHRSGGHMLTSAHITTYS